MILQAVHENSPQSYPEIQESSLPEPPGHNARFAVRAHRASRPLLERLDIRVIPDPSFQHS